MKFKPKTHTPLRVLINGKFICMDYLHQQVGQNNEQYKQMQYQIALGIIKYQLGSVPNLRKGFIWDKDKNLIFEVNGSLRLIKTDDYDKLETEFIKGESEDAVIPNVTLAVNNEAVFLNYSSIPTNLSPFAKRVRQLDIVRAYLQVVLMDRDDSAIFIYDNEIFSADCYTKKGVKIYPY